MHPDECKTDADFGTCPLCFEYMHSDLFCRNSRCINSEDRETIIEAFKTLREERDELRKVHSDFLQSEGGWIWAGDGYDHPESLTCPVVVKPEQVCEWVAAKAERDRLRRENEFISKPIVEINAEHESLLARVAELEEEGERKTSARCICPDCGQPHEYLSSGEDTGPCTAQGKQGE